MSELTYDQLKAKRLTIPLAELIEWDENPKGIKEEDFEQLRKDVNRQQFKPLIVTPREDGKAIVLGGNQRLRAMYAEGITDAWVSVIDFRPIEEGFNAYVNGEIDKDDNGNPVVFKTKKDGMIHYALKDNEERGYYEEVKLQELAYGSDLNLSEYKANMGEPVVLKTLVDEVVPTQVTQEPDNDPTTRPIRVVRKHVICPNCNELVEVDVEL